MAPYASERNDEEDTKILEELTTYLLSKEFHCPSNLVNSSRHFLCKAVNAFKAVERKDYPEAMRLLKDMTDGVAARHRSSRRSYDAEFEEMWETLTPRRITTKRHTVGGETTEDVPVYFPTPSYLPSVLHEDKFEDIPCTPQRPTPFDITKLKDLSTEYTPVATFKRLEPAQYVPTAIKRKRTFSEDATPSPKRYCPSPKPVRARRKTVDTSARRTSSGGKRKALVLTIKDNVLSCNWGYVSYLRNKLKGLDVFLCMVQLEDSTQTDLKRCWDSLRQTLVENLDVHKVNFRSVSCDQDTLEEVEIEIKKHLDEFVAENLF